MDVKVLYFAVLRERCGLPEETVALPAAANVGALKQLLESRHPFLAGRWGSVRVAVNMDFSSDDAPLHDGDEVALIPPVAGGSGHPRVRLTTEPLSLDRATQEVMTSGMGGLCIFAGMVRDHAKGRKVKSIDYSAYDAMAAKVMERIVRGAEEQHGARVACHHRLGHLELGEMAVIIAAAAPHRAESFAACRQVIEELKKDVPIWKHEYGEDGAVWVGMGP
ncbi:MAG: molybdopterin converting factor subunit 1 [Myxococcota bacterium]